MSLVESINSAVYNMSSAKMSLENGDNTQIELMKTKDDKEGEMLTYTTNIFMKKEDLTDKLKISLLLADDKKIEGTIEFVEKKEIEDSEIRKMEIKLVNKRIFEIIQLIQNREAPVEEKKACINQIEEIDLSLNDRFDKIMKMKGNKTLKGELLEEMKKCRESSRAVINALRGLNDFSNISNTVIAQLNNLAYSSINRSGLSKMIDKRAIANKTLYEDLEKESKEILSKLKIDDVRKNNE